RTTRPHLSFHLPQVDVRRTLSSRLCEAVILAGPVPLAEGGYRADRPLWSRWGRGSSEPGRGTRKEGPVRLSLQLRAGHADRSGRGDHMGALLMDGFPILSVMLAIPLVAAAACLMVGAQQARLIALVATLADLALAILLWVDFDIGGAQWQFTERAEIFAVFSY